MNAPGPGPGPAVPAAAAAADAHERLPREPYPGLRPFLDFEAALLFGRERQVREVIERLRQTQFVAVLGGSGSGKSSLIHAGVVPALRSYGIPGAGDLWLPMTCTPGTNVSAQDSAQRRHSPVTRLARRFAGLLRPAAGEAAAAERLRAIADVFRQEAGFARLLDAYGAELAVPPGPDPAEARVLFVLDQFEEIFHPTNAGVEDAALLVERVLDHFFNPHPRAHLVITMRSEHLNDCASFLELPDAINKSSYLIRRLDETELREAITGPAQRFLRLVARREVLAPGAASALPATVQFDDAVIERLLRDVRAITHDPDHLPLLQHLLARLWQAALEREAAGVPVPAQVTPADLLRAVGAGATDGAPPEERLNTLRACVENWPEAVYGGQGPAQRAQLDALFRQLAFKDPNTGLYSQQRVAVDAAAALLGPGKRRTELHALLSAGFLGSVDYLFWDDEDPSRVTLKVSHESFIRGWSRFRRLIDEESDHFDEYLGVLRKCAAWTAQQRGEDLLLETGEMRALRASEFGARLARPEQRAAWLRFLRLDRDGVRLARAEPALDDYFQASSRRLLEREQRARGSRRNRLLLAALALLLAPSALFSVLIQAPVTHRAELLFDAGNRANRAPLTPDYPGVGAAAAPLQSLLRAAELIDLARSGQGSTMARVSQALLRALDWIPPVHRQAAFLGGVAGQAEPPVNGKLRDLIGSALWWGGPAPAGEPVLAAPPVRPALCVPASDPLAAQAALPGRLLVAAGRPDDPRPRRAVFVPAPAGPGETRLRLLGASVDAASGHCVYGQSLIAIPLELDPAVVFDAGLRYFAYGVQGERVEVPSVTMLEIDWERVEADRSRIVQSQTRAVVSDAGAVARLRQAAGADRLAAVPSWRAAGGRVLGLPGRPWRVVGPSAQRLPAAAVVADFAPLAAPVEGSACRRLGQGWPVQAGFRNEMLEGAGYCFAITRGNPVAERAATPDAAGATPREQVLVAVYQRPDAAALAHVADNPPAPIASLPQFARIEPGDRRWQIGVRGPHAGWLALGGPDATGRERWLAAPWSTCALWRLGRDLIQPKPDQPDQPEAQGATARLRPEDAAVCRDR